MKLKIGSLTSGLVLGTGALLSSAVCAQGLSSTPASSAIATPGGPAASPVRGFQTSFAGKTIAPDENISLIFDSAVSATDGQFAVIVGTEDVTANFRWVSPTQLDGVFASAPLPSGSSALRIYQIAAGNQWVEIAQAEITVTAPAALSPTGSKTPVYRPSLILGIKSQLAEAHSAAATPPARATYADLTVQGGLLAELGGQDWSAKSQVNVVGSSYQPEAINFVEQGADAHQLEVANYLVEGSFTHAGGVSGISVGHVLAGTNPLLANGISNRGVVLRHQFVNRFDVSASLQNGTAIVGGENILGLNDSGHRFATFTAGAEVLERPGGLRLEVTSFQGTVKPKVTPGISTLQDAEESHGWGLRAISTNQDGSLRGDLAFARSTYTPKGNSALNIAPGPSTTASAWYAQLGYDLVKNAHFIPDYPLSLTLQARHEYSGSTYKSLGTGQGADYVNDTLALNGSLGVVTSQLQLGRRSDNVADASAFLKNRAPTLSLTVAAPLAQMVSATQPPLWAPTASYTYGRNRTFADTGFIPIGQTVADLPDVKVTSHGLGLSWTVNKLNVAYQYSRNLQDNNQPGFKLQDVLDTGHTVTLAYQVNDRLSLTSGAGKRLSLQRATGTERFNNTAQAGANWLFGDRFNVTANMSTSRDHDSTFTSDTKVLQGQLQLLKQFDLPAFGKKLPGQWSIGYTHGNTRSTGIEVRYQSLNAALSLSFF